jgi:hypothetical protein
MVDAATESVSDSKIDNIAGFKYAVTTTSAVSTIGYPIYMYIEYNPITPFCFPYCP